jgi:transposase
MQNNSSVVRQNLGIDVSKDSLAVVFSTIDSSQSVKVKASRSFANRSTGFQQLDKWIAAKKEAGRELTITLEATGIYYEQLAW